MTSTSSREAISPLRARMLEGMAIRKFSADTQRNYIAAVKKLADFLGRPPDTATPEDLRRFQLHLTRSGAGTPTINNTVSALRFFFKVTLGRDGIDRCTQFVREPRKLPVVLSPEEVSRLLDWRRTSRCSDERTFGGNDRFAERHENRRCGKL